MWATGAISEEEHEEDDEEEAGIGGRPMGGLLGENGGWPTGGPFEDEDEDEDEEEVCGRPPRLGAGPGHPGKSDLIRPKK